MLPPRFAVRVATTRAIPRRAVQARVWQRSQSSTTASRSSPSIGALLAAGVAGGVTVLGAAYAYYHFSGVKKVVDASKSAHQYLTDTKDSLIKKAPKNPNEVLAFLRSVVKSYTVVIPGASALVDSSFDVLDELHDTHHEELDRILKGAFDEVTEILKAATSKGLEGLDAATVARLMGVLGRRAGELHALAGRASEDAFKRFEGRYPSVGKVLGTALQDLRSLAQHGGPKAKQIVKDSVGKVQSILNEKDAPNAVSHAKDVLLEKTKQLEEMLWDRTIEEAKENPELRALLEENKDAFLKDGTSVEVMKEVLSRMREAAKEGKDLNKERLNELRVYLRDKATGKERQSFQDWVKSMSSSENMPNIDVQALVQMTHKKSQEAKRLAEETYRDVAKVLQEKSAKARHITDQGKDEVKEQGFS